MEQSLISFLIAGITVFISYKGFNNGLFQERYAFDVEKILVRKDYIRMISSGFLHNNWWHLIFNMIALLAFAGLLEAFIGGLRLLVIYFAALLGGNLLALFIHKNHGDYTSVGASGAVNGIVFASIAIFPDGGIGLLLLPFSIPSWVFGILYVLFSIYGIKAKWGNSGHAAHLGGALVGMLLAIVMYPEIIQQNYLPILLILLPIIGFIVFIIYKPEILLTSSFTKKKSYYSIDQEYNRKKIEQQSDIDSILEKIHKRGMNSLTKKEKEALEQYSKMRR